jgi:competence protein ComEC
MVRYMSRSMRALFATLAFAAFTSISCSAQQMRAPAAGDLKIFFIDVEGGQATLFITPAGQSLLIDTGWPGNNFRDADRIAGVAKSEGLTKLDYVLITHYHDDHVGGVPQLVARIPVGTFLDHGPNRELDHGPTDHGYAEYQRATATAGSKRLTLHPGEQLPLKGLTATVISADGETLSKPLTGAGQPNEVCKSSEVRAADTTENARSLGIEITFGKLKVLDLGDLTWDKEMQLMCPLNMLGHIDIDIVSHHGYYQSSSPALIYAIHPRIAIMDNGAKKGGSTEVLARIRKTPGLETLWQLHYSEEGGPANNTAQEYIANPQGVDSAHLLKVTASADGSFEVLNSRTNLVKKYSAK